MKIVDSTVGATSGLVLAIYNFAKENLAKVSAHTLGWVAIILLFLANIPTLLAVLMGKSDILPPVDLMVFLYAGMIALFFKALIEKNSLYIATICLGFASHAVMQSLILYK